MSNWYHGILGRYNISDKWIGLDYASLLMSEAPVAESVLAHEMAHNVMADTDFGQATYVIIKLLKDLNHLNDQQKVEVGKMITKSQEFVQEGLATLFQVARLRNLTDKQYALNWVEQTLPSEYQDKLQRLSFVLDLSQSYRDFFTGKISYLVLETGIRKELPRRDLLQNPEKLRNYLTEEKNNPDLRLEKLISTLKYKAWLVTKPIPEIAKECDVEYFEPSTKQECADYLTYVASFTNNPHIYTVENIIDAPQGVEAFKKAAENMIVGNMNMDFTNPADVLFKLQDFIFYSNKMEIVFISPNENIQDRELIKSISGHEPEINISGFLRTGEKYLTTTSKEKAAEILNNDLKNATIWVKWGGFNTIAGKFTWSDKARPADLVIYNNAEQMLDTFKELLKQKPSTKLLHLHAGSRENHPLQTLFIKIENESPIHAVNTWGNTGITNILTEIKKVSKVMPNEVLKENKKHINNLLSLWNGMHWDIDWVETMIDGKVLSFR